MLFNPNLQTFNKKICKECGGRCCKNCGCIYSVDDFKSLTYGNLKSELDQGRASIISTFVISSNCISYFLSLRARNIDRDVVDLFSAKTTCFLLTEIGCSLDDFKRSQGGVLYIPHENGNCESLYTEKIAYQEWIQYQKILERLTRYFSGKTSRDKLKKDIIQVAYYLGSKMKNNVIDLSGYSREERELWKTLNLIMPTYENEIKEGFL